jgi:cell wall-associated NlpC family hydrolase
MINRYLSIPYVRGGRDVSGADCYGLVRLARTELFGKSWLPLHAEVMPGQVREMTAACAATAGLESMAPCAAEPGAIATAWRAGLCVHVGIVVQADGRQWVLESDEPTGPCLTPLSDFERRYTKVVYYGD